MDFVKSQNLKLTDKSGRSVPPSDLQGKVVALYFSAHWCPPCKGFTPLLKEFYKSIKGQGLPLEIVFVSSDKSESEASSYFQNDHGDWLMLDLGQKAGVSDKFQIKGIPTLIVIDPAGKAVASDARDQVASTAQKPEAAGKVFADWQKLCKDWRATAGESIGGAPAAQDAAAMRAARLARLGGGYGGPPVPASVPAPAQNPAPVPAAMPVPETDSTPVPAVIDVESVAKSGATIQPDRQAIQQITAMGFTEEQAKNALNAADGNVETAVSILLE